VDARRLTPHFADSSGGLGYHLRAWRWRKTLWSSFIATAQGWQRAWTPTADELIVVGPSAGYTLDAGFLARFRTVHALEPDPLARWLLRRRFPHIDWHFGSLDCLADTNGPTALATAYPTAAILFANVLGQAVDPALLPAWRPALVDSLRGHHWASFHDVLSCAHAPRPIDITAHFPSSSALARGLWRKPVEVIDHDTFGLAPAERRLACWHLAPARWQIVEWGCHAPEQP